MSEPRIHKVTSNLKNDMGWAHQQLLASGTRVWCVLREPGIAILFVAASIEQLREWTHLPEKYDSLPTEKLTVRQLYHRVGVNGVSFGPECAWPGTEEVP